MNDDLLKMLPTLLTLLVGLISVAVLPALRLSRTLRRDLTADAQVVDSLPPAEQRELRADMGERSRLIVAYSRYPSSTRIETAAAFAVLVVSALQVLSLSSRSAELRASLDLESWGFAGFAAAFQTAIAGIAAQAWARRAVQRLTYVNAHVSPGLRQDVAESTALSYWLIRWSIVAVVAGTAGYALIACLPRWESADPLGAIDIGFVVSMFLMTVLLAVISRQCSRHRALAELAGELPISLAAAARYVGEDDRETDAGRRSGRRAIARWWGR